MSTIPDCACSQNETQTHPALGDELEKITKVPVYYQPAGKYKLEYPCVKYKRTKISPIWADNAPYILTYGYEVIYITKDPDDLNPMRIARLEMCRLVRIYEGDNLYHYVFEIYR